MRVLYLSYNGLLDPLGQSQVLQYLVGLAGVGHRITLVTFEKPDEWLDVAHRARTSRVAADAGIRWIPLRYHHRPSGVATAFDIAVGLIVAGYLTIRHRIELVHSRSHVPSIIASVLKSVFRVKFLFDPRGFWPDERVELGIWRAGSAIHRFAKWQERSFLRKADAVVTLTESAEATMRAEAGDDGRRQRFRVITTCANLALFRQDRSVSRARSGPFTLGYLGTVGTPYLLDEVFAALAVARSIRSDSRLLILNRRDHDYILSRARTVGAPMDAIDLKAVTHDQVPEELQRISAGVIFITPTPCRRSCAPTKLGEFLAAGIPCIANAGVGDLEKLLSGEGAGVIVPDMSVEALRKGMRELIELSGRTGTAETCERVAQQHFSLEEGVKAYDGLYREMALAGRTSLALTQ